MARSSLPLSAYTNTPTDAQRSQPEKQMDTVAELQRMAPVYPASVETDGQEPMKHLQNLLWEYHWHGEGGRGRKEQSRRLVEGKKNAPKTQREEDGLEGWDLPEGTWASGERKENACGFLGEEPRDGTVTGTSGTRNTHSPDIQLPRPFH